SAASKIVESADGFLWVNAGNSLLRVDPGHASATRVASGAEQIQALAIDAGGRVWSGFHGGLRTVSRDGKESTFPLPDALGTDVICLLQTSEHQLWICTANRLGEFDGKNTRVISGLPGNRVTNIFEDREHAIWVATDHGIARIVGDHVSALTSKEGLSSGLVLAFYEDREGNLWLGTESGGASI